MRVVPLISGLALATLLLPSCSDPPTKQNVNPNRPPHATWITSRDLRNGIPDYFTHVMRELRINPTDSSLVPREIEWELATSFGIWYARPGEFPANDEWFRVSGALLITTPNSADSTRVKLASLLALRGDTVTSSSRDTFVVALANCCGAAGIYMDAEFDFPKALDHYLADTSACRSVQPPIPYHELLPMEENDTVWWPGIMW